MRANLLPIVEPNEGEELVSFLQRAATAMEWPEASRTQDMDLFAPLLREGTDEAGAIRRAGHLIRALSFTAEPSMALRHLERYVRAAPDGPSRELDSLILNSEQLHFLASLFAFSQFLSEVLITEPGALPTIMRKGRLNREKPLSQYEAEIATALHPVADFEARRSTLTRYKKRELLRIGIRDMRDMADVLELCRELSALAQAIVRAAYTDCRARIEARHGTPVSESTGQATAFCIYAMGKFGAGELNFSSDVDLVFIYDEEGETTGVAEMPGGLPIRRITNHDFFGRICRDLSTYLTNLNPEGFLYRVDLRLRPEGDAGPLARSRSAYSAYLQSQAGLWEKIAYLKARFIAGEETLALRFDGILETFVYLENLPEEVLPEVAHLKRRIDHERLGEDGRELDIKRGVGGIREIEFLVAARQLLHGEKVPVLRVRPTLLALGLLVKEGLVTAEVAERLESAYHFFRRIEHTLQMMHESQTHRMPSDPAARAALALRCGHLVPAEFEKRLHDDREFVRREFEILFNTDSSSTEMDFVDWLLSGNDAPESMLTILSPAGLDSLDGFRALQELAIGTREFAPSAKGKLGFQRLLPQLLAELPQVPDPLAAVRQFAVLLRAAHGYTWIYTLCLENPSILKLLLRALGFGGFFGRELSAHPEYLDEVFTGGGLNEGRTDDALAFARIAIRRLPAADAIVRLRTVKQLEAVLIALQEVLGIASSLSAARRTTRLATFVLEETALIATRLVLGEEAAARFTMPWAVLGLGGLGDDQVHLHGDLDVGFVVARDEELDGQSTVQWVERIGRRLVTELGAVTPVGQLWKVDARLRPDGKSGPLVTTADRLREYYGSEAGLWEWQALTKMRAVAGDVSFGETVRRGLINDWNARPHDRTELAREIHTMRGRMEAAVKLPAAASCDIKRSAGGLVDIEFLVQYLLLADQGNTPEVYALDTMSSLAHFGRMGALAETDTGFLRDAYAEFRAIQRAQRLLNETAKDFLPNDPMRRQMLARAVAEQLGLRAQAAVAEFEDRMAAVREVYARVLGV